MLMDQVVCVNVDIPLEGEGRGESTRDTGGEWEGEVEDVPPITRNNPFPCIIPRLANVVLSNFSNVI